MDLTITQWINNLSGAGGAMDLAMVAVTTYAVPVLILLVVAQWWLGQPRPLARHACIAAGASFLLGLGLAQVILLFVHRLRPYDAGVSHLIIEKTADWSFPSDHAIASTSIVFAWALNGMRRWLALFGALAAVICFSRIYVGMHYASDVLGGMGVALVAALLVKAVYKPDTRLDRWLTSWF
ncbi:MAG: phosphatase PAP2 family protein [Alphaproteobacteria bacterium]|nr:phosphatase PAP2 family protein [Alphaproteobacteria bacterium]